MRARDPRLWLGLVSLTLVLGLFAADYEKTSPGPLSPSHAALAQLQGQASCDACHGGWLADMTTSCLDCHEAIEHQLETATGLHGARVAAERGADGARACQACHVEHHGDALPLAGAEAFALTGIGDRDAFDHGHVAFTLEGRHDALACAGCHERADAPVLAEGQTRFLGLVQDCASCHDDPHQGRFARGCADCHGQERPFGELASFTHGQAFPLVGAHARPSCVECHVKGGDHEVEDLAGHGPAPAARTCRDCHASPHRASFTAEAARREGLAEGDSCALCHDAGRGPFAGEAAEMPSGLHAASGFALARPHDEVGCEACHGPQVRATTQAVPLSPGTLPADASEAFAARFPGRSADGCGGCHADPHGGQFAVEPYLAGGCLACHTREAFDPPAFGASEHAGAGFALEGTHARTACDACHLPPEGAVDAPRAFRGTPRDCAGCHDDPHGGQFDAAPYAQAGCAACHGLETFAPPTFGAAEHAGVGFALDRRHASVACDACHLQPAGDGTAPRVFRGTPRSCAGCHDDVHGPTRAGEFSGPLARREELGGCAACHVPERFADVSHEDFEHLLWAGFGLDGAHARAACASCHPRADAPGADGRTFGRVSERFPAGSERCADCHADPHRGAFAPAPGATEADGCARCHTTEGFRAGEATAGFDHGRWTGFALEGAHARAECAVCHGAPPAPVVPTPGTGPLAAARSFGLVSERLGRAPDTCAACHVDPHRGRFDDERSAETGVSCERCHTSESFQDVDRAGFDHDRWTGFRLVGAHQRAACQDCHAPAERPDAEGLRLGAAPGEQCADCHADPHVGQFAREGRSDCARCHLEQGGWDPLAFDHQRDARFALDARHLGLDCAACHRPWPLRDGREAVRYRPLGTACIDCHDPTGRRDRGGR